MLCACRVQAINTGFAVQNVDVLSIKTCLKKCFNRGMRAGRIRRLCRQRGWSDRE